MGRLSGFIQWFYGFIQAQSQLLMIRGQNCMFSGFRLGPLGSLEYIIQRFDFLELLESHDSVQVLILSSRISTMGKKPCVGLENCLNYWGVSPVRAQSCWAYFRLDFSPQSVLGGHLCVVSNLQNHIDSCLILETGTRMDHDSQILTNLSAGRSTKLINRKCFD